MLYRSTSRMCLYYTCFLFFSSPSLCNFWTNGMMSALLLAISMLAPGSLRKRPFLRWPMLNIETLQSFYEIAVEHKALVPFYCLHKFWWIFSDKMSHDIRKYTPCCISLHEDDQSPVTRPVFFLTVHKLQILNHVWFSEPCQKWYFANIKA